MTAATVGLGIWATAVNDADRSCARWTMSAYDWSANSLMSAPPAKAFCPP